MTFSPTQIAIAIYIKEALEQADHIEWHKGLCGHVYSYVSDKGIVGGLSPRRCKIFGDLLRRRLQLERLQREPLLPYLAENPQRLASYPV